MIEHIFQFKFETLSDYENFDCSKEPPQLSVYQVAAGLC